MKLLDGTNLIKGSISDNRIEGGSGTDTYDLTSAGSAVTVSIAGLDNVVLAGTSGVVGTDTLSSVDVLLLGDARNDTVLGVTHGLTVDGGDNGTDVDTIDLSNATYAPVTGGKGYTVNLSNSAGFVQNEAGSVTMLLQDFENAVGTAGKDTFYGNEGNNTIDGGGETDTMSYTNVTSDALTVNLVPGASSGFIATGAVTGTDTLKNIESLIGSTQDDRFIGLVHGVALDGGLGTANQVIYTNLSASLVVDLTAGTARTQDSSVTQTLANIQNVKTQGSSRRKPFPSVQSTCQRFLHRIFGLGLVA